MMFQKRILSKTEMGGHGPLAAVATALGCVHNFFGFSFRTVTRACEKGVQGVHRARKSSGFRVKFWYRTHNTVIKLAYSKNISLFTTGNW